jgi:hypothetical protein
MTGGKKIIEGLQDAVAHARASNPDLTRLRALAEAAEPGPWRAMPLEFDDWGMIRGGGFRLVAVARHGSLNADQDECRRRKIVPPGIKRNMAHIAAMDPPTTIALLDRLEAAEARPPKLGNCGTDLAHDNKGQWHYINHANTWQLCPGPAAKLEAELDAAAARIEELQAELQEQDEIINRLKR